MNEWQPIETAPVDTRILLWDGKYVSVGEVEGWAGGRRDVYAMGREHTAMVYDNEAVELSATHWMPLPDPPTAS